MRSDGSQKDPAFHCPRYPMTGIAGCCARAANSSDSPPPPTNVMKSRRLIVVPLRLQDIVPIRTGT